MGFCVCVVFVFLVVTYLLWNSARNGVAPSRAVPSTRNTRLLASNSRRILHLKMKFLKYSCNFETACEKLFFITIAQPGSIRQSHFMAERGTVWVLINVLRNPLVYFNTLVIGSYTFGVECVVTWIKYHSVVKITSIIPMG